MTTRAINGIYNRSSVGGRVRKADTEFYPLLDALRRLQQSGAVRLRLEKRGPNEAAMLILSAKRRAEVAADLQIVQKTLGIKPNSNGELLITFVLLPRNPAEIAVLTRSMIEIPRSPEVSRSRLRTLRTVARSRARGS